MQPATLGIFALAGFGAFAASACGTSASTPPSPTLAALLPGGDNSGAHTGLGSDDSATRGGAPGVPVPGPPPSTMGVPANDGQAGAASTVRAMTGGTASGGASSDPIPPHPSLSGAAGSGAFPSGSGGAPPVASGGAPPVASGGAPPVASGGTPPTPTGGSTGAGGSLTGGSDVPTMLPSPKEACQPFKTGSMTFLGLPVTIWAGTKPASGKGGPVVFYWHGTATNGQEAISGLSQAGIAEATSEGGVVAAFEGTSGKGALNGDIWFTGDFDVADQILACAIQELGIDTRRIYSAGYSGGGLQVGLMAYARSGYLASVVVYSGGVLFPPPPQDPSNVPAALGAHGAPGSDSLILDFGTITTTLLQDLRAKGASVAIDCNDGSAHIDIFKRFAVGPQAWQFLKDHPFKVRPEPYTQLPAGWPSYCKIL